MKRILRITASMNPAEGGVVEAISQSLKLFNSDDWKMDVVCFDDPRCEWLSSYEQGEIFSFKGVSSYNINVHFLIWLIRNSKNYDLVVIDGLWQFSTISGYLLKLLNVPYCVFVHGMLDPYFNKDRIKFLKKIPFWFLIERNVLYFANSVIFTCKEESELAMKSFPFYKSNPRIATLGVADYPKSDDVLESAFYDQFPSLKGKKIGLFLSRIHPKKGIDLLVEALDNVLNLPDNFILAIAGPVNTPLQKELTHRIHELNLTDRICWLGMLAGDVKWGAYCASDFFILPSHQENFGIVVAESLSRSTPVLITNKVNIWREVVAGKAGFVGDDSVAGVTSILNQWFSSSAFDQDLMRDNSRDCFYKYFSKEISYQALANVFESSLSSSCN